MEKEKAPEGATTNKKKDKKAKGISQEVIAKIKNPELRAIVKRINQNLLLNPKYEAQKIENEIAPHFENSKQEKFPFAPLPRDLCRISPFFPLSQKSLKDREYKKIIVTETAWGKIEYTGPILSTYEEDVFIILLALINYRDVKEIEGKRTYSYVGPILPILKLLGYKKVGKTNYRRILSSLDILAKASFKMIIKKRGWNVTNMITFFKWDEIEKKLYVTINPYFYEIYIKRRYTLQDVKLRAKLSSPSAKALLRFISSHSTKWQGHYLTLAHALNLNLDQPKKKIKNLIKKSVNELIKTGVLENTSGFLKENKEVIRLQKSKKWIKK